MVAIIVAHQTYRVSFVVEKFISAFMIMLQFTTINANKVSNAHVTSPQVQLWSLSCDCAHLLASTHVCLGSMHLPSHDFVKLACYQCTLSTHTHVRVYPSCACTFAGYDYDARAVPYR